MLLCDEFKIVAIFFFSVRVFVKLFNSAPYLYDNNSFLLFAFDMINGFFLISSFTYFFIHLFRHFRIEEGIMEMILVRR